MARTQLALSPFVANGTLADPAGVAVDAANGMYVSGAKLERIILRVKNADAADKTVTIKAGVAPPALEAGQGDLAVTVTAGTTKWIGPFTSGRFAQKDGSINVDFSAATSTTITAFQDVKS